ncbi:fumarylacetoacetate hydrolase family protein [Rhodococcus sp. BP-349]|uniref:fumarylacetoacetate hydrolase family protein n=1 Tax=unclassified Rhodococcus (in: high G+C Gram-positive bacteria) TaxID=192944 RepID=UPI001C9AED46|nr:MULTISPECIES: fumarylacetoacetate hydrolase family protein [unclassified Rhodococcus (in: high G+C Gram-positive bacteria)]MBY6538837.1 fumarylacetoacetate hydrolase family protein [Rhodococcus sp. BP-363]MBY6543174.1 fumarylacetoacetate hydrolase family protein [Rhodococcus sp. BP-369]MBY6562404.1 fumarylacetoacetate hydrolase family protein [Rhodococcus sp. BP-370]MBY6576696.1 fumarylacetoacetate hydrolase family protein [Rhodococcus sp. BP-364]MBY6585997.1 fumarylacetoacetate hydrolase f
MRIANHDDRLTLLAGDTAIDVATASDGLFDHRIEHIYDRWDEFITWCRHHAPRAQSADAAGPGVAAVGAVSPRPRQIFGVGLNYVDHAAEAGSPLPTVPLLFTKFPSAIAGPNTTITLTGPSVDWEVELVVVVGRRCEKVNRADAWSHVAGLTVGQDISDRDVQLQGANSQYSFGKSFENFAPIGPVLVTPDEFDDPDSLALRCSVNGEIMQDGTSSNLVFPVSELIEYISARVTLFPGDLIFTGTPAGVGLGRSPRRYLRAGDVIVSTIEGIGGMTNKMTDLESASPESRHQAAGAR